MRDVTARMLCTLGIWAGVTVILTFGVFRFNWGTEVGLIVVVAIICGSAAASTAVLWRFGGSVGSIPDKIPASI